MLHNGCPAASRTKQGCSIYTSRPGYTACMQKQAPHTPFEELLRFTTVDGPWANIASPSRLSIHQCMQSIKCPRQPRKFSASTLAPAVFSARIDYDVPVVHVSVRRVDEGARSTPSVGATLPSGRLDELRRLEASFMAVTPCGEGHPPIGLLSLLQERSQLHDIFLHL